MKVIFWRNSFAISEIEGIHWSLLDVAYIRYQNDGNTKNTSVRNTFVLKNGQKRITLYYQPVIFDTDQRSVNGIGLYRNNSISVYAGNEDDCRQGGHYYVPDF